MWCSYPWAGGNATSMHAAACVCSFCHCLAQEQAKVLLKLIFLACSPQCQLHRANLDRALISLTSANSHIALIKRSNTQIAGQDLEVRAEKMIGGAAGTFCVWCARGRVYFCGSEPVDKDDWPFIVLTEHTNWFLKEQVTRRQPE